MMREDPHSPVGKQGEPTPGPSLHRVWYPYLRQRLSRVRSGSPVRCCLMRAPLLKGTPPIPTKKNLKRWSGTGGAMMKMVMVRRAMMRGVMMRRVMTRNTVTVTNGAKRSLHRLFPYYSPSRVSHPEVIVGTMRVPQVHRYQVVLRDTTPALEWKIQPGREPSFDAPSAPFATTELAPTALQRCRKPRLLHPLPGPAYWPLREFGPPGWCQCGHAAPRLPGSPKGKEQGRRSLAAAPRPSVQGQTTKKCPCTPTSLLAILVLYPSVVNMLLYCHSQGGHVKPNIAAVSCDSVVNNGVSQRYHRHQCDPIRINPDMSPNNVLIVQKSWGKRFSANPLYTRSDRESEILWHGQEVDKVEAIALAEETELRLWLNSGGRLLPETGRLNNTDAPLAPSAVLRCTPTLWPTTSDGTMIFSESTDSPHGRSWKYRPVFPRVRPRWSRPTIPPTKTSLDAGYHSIPMMERTGCLREKRREPWEEV